MCGFRAESDNKLKAHKRACPAWQGRDKKAVRAERLRENSLAKHGVENPMHSPEADRKRAETNLARYGAENPFARGASTYEKVQESLVGKRGAHGAANAFARPEVKEKVKATMRERYGAENPQQVPAIRARTTATCEERYGGVLLSSPVLAEKARETNQALYGDEFPQRTEGVKSKQQETNLARYGVPWSSMNPEARASFQTFVLRLSEGLGVPLSEPAESHYVLLGVDNGSITFNVEGSVKVLGRKKLTKEMVEPLESSVFSRWGYEVDFM